jgi:FAD linked oxidases, C-terminal domain
VGIGKKQYLNEELGEGTVNLMKLVKRAIDPLGLFNPGKVSTYLSLPRSLLTLSCILPHLSCILTHLQKRKIRRMLLYNVH